MTTPTSSPRRCFRDPIPEIYDSARYLDAAVSAHMVGQHDVATELFMLANDPKVWSWTDSLWGKNSSYVHVTKLHDRPNSSKKAARMPTTVQIGELHARDGFHCRFCELPVIRPQKRRLISQAYPAAVPWGRTNASQHAGFQAMWAQYDHVVPHALGGTNDLDNLVVTCAACNYGKMSYTLQELNLIDPRLHPPIQSNWDGLERFEQRASKDANIEAEPA